MKKVAFALTISAVNTIAHSQTSSVTLAGIFDNGLMYVSNEKVQGQGKSVFSTTTSALQGNRLIFKGIEDLGGGSSVGFWLENGFNGVNGRLAQGGLLWGRQAWVSLRNDSYGIVRFGRQYTPAFDMQHWYAANGKLGLYTSHFGDLDDGQGSAHVNNSIKYLSPTWAGVSFEGFYGMPNGDSTLGSTVGAGAKYTASAVEFATSYTVVRNPFASWYLAPSGNTSFLNGAYASGGTPATSLQDGSRERIFTLAGKYTISPLEFNVLYSLVNIDDSLYFRSASRPNGSRFKAQNFELNATWFINPYSALIGAVAYTAGEVAATGAKPNWQQYSLGYQYFLSKRTTLYSLFSYQHAGGDSISGTSPVAQISMIPSSSSANQSLFVVGINHKF